MITYNNKQYRNLEEQVLKNEDDIEVLKSQKNISDLGINIIQVEPLPNAAALPTDYEGSYGDAYLVGLEAPFDLYVWTRSNQVGVPGYWFDWGPLNAPSTVPGPIGPQGIQGEQGVRGSLWYSQSGGPTNTEGVNDNDQALDGITGDVYQFVNGKWQRTGNIRGPQGIQGIQGIQGLVGPVGPVGPQGPKGDQGQFIQIIGTLDNINQLPDPSSVPRYSAYLIPKSGTNHVYLIVGEGTTENPLEWVDAGGFGDGTVVVIGGVEQNSVDMSSIPKIDIIYQIGDSTTVSSNGSEVTFSNLQTTGYNANNEQIEGLSTIELPITASDDISLTVDSNTLQMQLTQGFWDKIDSAVGDAKPVEVQITAPSIATNGQLTADQLATLQNNAGAYLMFNKEIFRLQDVQHEEGYLIYSHIGFQNVDSIYMIKCITITISTRGWVLTKREIADSNFTKKYQHNIYVRYLSGTVRKEAIFSLINEDSTSYAGRGSTTLGRRLAQAVLSAGYNSTSNPPCIPASGQLIYDGHHQIVAGVSSSQADLANYTLGVRYYNLTDNAYISYQTISLSTSSTTIYDVVTALS